MAAAAGHGDLRAERRAPPVVLANIQTPPALMDRLELHRSAGGFVVHLQGEGREQAFIFSFSPGRQGHGALKGVKTQKSDLLAAQKKRENVVFSPLFAACCLLLGYREKRIIC